MVTKIKRNPTSRDLREFGWVILIGFGLIGWAALYKGHAAGAAWIWKISGAVGLWTLLFPSLAKPFYRAWMGLGAAIGAVTSRIVLAVIFYGLLTPLALFFRWRRRDALRLKRPAGSTYWSNHPEISKTNYEHTF